MNTHCRCYCNNNFTVIVKNDGYFCARISVNYFNDGKFIAVSSDVLNHGYIYKTTVPSTAYNVVFRAYNLSLTQTQVICENFYQVPKDLSVSLFGTADNPQCSEL